MTKIFLDTEFPDDGHRIEPVSLALVSQATAGYYAVCADSDITQVVAHPWLRAHVVPHLPITVTASGWHWDSAHADFAHVKPRAQIAGEDSGSSPGSPSRRSGPGTPRSTRSCSASCSAR